MRENASFNGLRRLFSFTAIAALSITLLFLSGCGHKCGCNSCHRNSCSTCNTCGVSDNSTPSNTVCTACQTGTCNNVGVAPASLSEPVAVQTPVRQVNAPAYSTGSNYNGTNASLDRAGESRDLPVFSAPVAQQPVAAPIQAYAQPPAGSLVQDAPRGGGQYHTLQQGETVYALSRKYGVKAKTILEANHFNDPNHLSVGTKVFIPAN